MFFTVYITACNNTIGIVGEREYKNLEEFKSKLKAANEPFDKTKDFLYHKKLSLNKDHAERITLRREAQFTIENALGAFLDCKNLFDEPLAEYFKNIGMSAKEFEHASIWFQGAKNRALGYLEDYYLKDASLGMLKRYESIASVSYSESYVQNEKKESGITRIGNILEDIHTNNFSIKYLSHLNNFFMIPFAIINYLISHGYRIKKCKHCHKYFAVNSIKSRRKIYCDRNSPCEGFNHLDCEQAVRNILTKLSRERSSISKKLDNKGEVYELEEFSNECRMYKDKIKQESSVENLQEYEQFLKNYKIKGT